VIVSPLSHCYRDLPSAEPSSSRRKPTVRAALVYRSVRPRPLRNRSARNQPKRSGPIEAVIWAETIADFDDLTFMLLPRLRGLAHRAWSPANSASSPIAVTASQHPDELWTQYSLASFRASTVNSL
jgi:hexosaminidase